MNFDATVIKFSSITTTSPLSKVDNLIVNDNSKN